MNLKNSLSDNPKIELTPLIDVIFLLLIFFLVTLNSFSVSKGKGKEERSYSLPVLSQSDPTHGHMILYLFRVPADHYSIHSFYILNQGNMGGNTSFSSLRSSFWHDINSITPPFPIQLTSLLNSLQFLSQLDPSDMDLLNKLRQVQEVIVVCDDEIPYEDIHEYVEKIRIAQISNLKIVPRVLGNQFIGPPPNGIQPQPINQITRRYGG